jgi:hypothetical protein
VAGRVGRLVGNVYSWATLFGLKRTPPHRRLAFPLPSSLSNPLLLQPLPPSSLETSPILTPQSPLLLPPLHLRPSSSRPCPPHSVKPSSTLLPNPQTTYPSNDRYPVSPSSAPPLLAELKRPLRPRPSRPPRQYRSSIPSQTEAFRPSAGGLMIPTRPTSLIYRSCRPSGLTASQRARGRTSHEMMERGTIGQVLLRRVSFVVFMFIPMLKESRGVKLENLQGNAQPRLPSSRSRREIASKIALRVMRRYVPS